MINELDVYVSLFSSWHFTWYAWGCVSPYVSYVYWRSWLLCNHRVVSWRKIWVDFTYLWNYTWNWVVYLAFHWTVSWFLHMVHRYSDVTGFQNIAALLGAYYFRYQAKEGSATTAGTKVEGNEILVLVKVRFILSLKFFSVTTTLSWSLLHSSSFLCIKNTVVGKSSFILCR